MSNDKLRKGISDAIKSERDYNIILRRKDGLKLDEVGEEFDITRERVRQLEYRGKTSMIDYIESIATNKMFTKHIRNNCVDKDSIVEEIGEELWEVVLYSYKTKDKSKSDTKLDYSDYLQTLTTYNVKILHSALDLAKENADTTITRDLLPQMRSDLNDQGFKLTNALIKNALTKMGYREFGEFTLRDGVNIGESIRNEVKYNYKDGIKTSSKEDIDKLRDIIDNKYKHHGIKNKNIISRIQQSLYLWDSSTYNHEDNIIIDEDLKEDIVNYIKCMHKQGVDRITYKKIFEVFEDELRELSNLKNHNSLHGLLSILSELEGEDFICIRFYVCKPGTEKLKSKDYFLRVAELLLDYPEGLTEKQIAEKITGFEEAMVRYTYAYYPEVVKWGKDKKGKNKYVNLYAIKVSDEDKILMEDILRQLLDNKLKYSSKYIMYQFYEKNHPDLLKRLNVDGSKSKLYDLNKFLFEDRYTFNTPHIIDGLSEEDKGFTTETFAEILLEKGFVDTKKKAFKKAISIYKGDYSYLQ